MKKIKLSQGKVALVSDEDFTRVSKIRWYAISLYGNHFYARAWIRRKKVSLHRFILSARAGVTIDHINGDGLDNRRENLRWCTAAQNCMNRRVQKHSSRYKGVRWHAANRSWITRIKIHGKLRHIGCFSAEDDAGLAYNKEAVKLFGEFALLNVIPGKTIC